MSNPKPNGAKSLTSPNYLRSLLLMFAFFGMATRALADWPTYQHDYARSGVTDEELALPLAPVWRYTALHAPAPAWPPPAAQDFWHHKTDLPARVIFDRAFHVVSDGRAVYFGSSADDAIRSLDLRTGDLRWAFFCGGPIRLAPSLHADSLFAGSDDGCVYRLRSESGELVWQRRAHEVDRRIPGNGRIISVWPVRSGVIVHDDRVRFASGLFPLQGTFQHVLSMTSGEMLAAGPLDFSPQGYLRLEGNRLSVPQGRSKLAVVAEVGAGDHETGPQLPAEAAFEVAPLSLIRAGSTRFVGRQDEVVAMDHEGTTIWRHSVEGGAYGLAVAGGALMVSTNHGLIYCFRGAAAATDNLTLQKKTDAPAPNLDVRDDVPESQRFGEIVEFLEEEETRHGYALLIGDTVAETAKAITARTELQVVGMPLDDARLQSERARLAQQGKYGRIVLQHQTGDQLPYGSSLFNLVVVDAAGNESSTPALANEILRLLRPGAGLALIEFADGSDGARRERPGHWMRAIPPQGFTATWKGRWLQIRRAELSGIGDWTHMYGSPSNTACSNDQLVGNQLKLQWFGPPGPRQMVDRHHRTVPPLYAAGRLFVPGNDRVFAVDAYNGSPLWDTAVSEFRRVGVMRDSGSMAAAADYLYVVARDRCYGLNSTSGSYDLNFTVPPVAGGRDWGYLAYVDNFLVGSTTRPGSSRGEHSRKQINETYFDFVPVVTSDGLFGLDRHSGELHWHYRAAEGAIVNPTITIANGRIYFVESRNRATLNQADGRSTLEALVGTSSDLVAIDLASGNAVYRKTADLTAIQHHLYLCHADGKLIAVGSKNKRAGKREFVWYDLHAFDANDGSLLWSATQNQRQVTNGDHGEQDHHPAIVNGVLYQEPYAYEAATGKRMDDWQFTRGGHGCGTVAASAQAFFFRAGNPTLRDLRTGINHKVTAVSRPGCWINMIPAGGLLLIPEASSGCTCDFPIQSSIALISEAAAGPID